LKCWTPLWRHRVNFFWCIKNKKILAVNLFFNFWPSKTWTLIGSWSRIRIGIQPKMLDPDPYVIKRSDKDCLLITQSTFTEGCSRMANKGLIIACCVQGCGLSKNHINTVPPPVFHFGKDQDPGKKVIKKSQNSRNKGFFRFLFVDRRVRIRIRTSD
jgi:hypothetical protein